MHYWRQIGDEGSVAVCLEGIASALCAAGVPAQAARLLGAAQHCARRSAPLFPATRWPPTAGWCGRCATASVKPPSMMPGSLGTASPPMRPSPRRVVPSRLSRIQTGKRSRPARSTTFADATGTRGAQARGHRACRSRDCRGALHQPARPRSTSVASCRSSAPALAPTRHSPSGSASRNQASSQHHREALPKPESSRYPSQSRSAVLDSGRPSAIRIKR